MTSNIKELDPVQGLVDYVLDIKPYHTKIVEVLIEYVYGENVNVTVLDEVHLKLDFYTPFDEFAVNSCGGYDTRAFDDPTLVPILSPNVADQFISGFNYGIDAVNDRFIIIGDRTGDFRVGETILISSFVEDYADVNNIIQTTGNNFGSFTIADVEYDGGSIDSWPDLLDPSSYTIGNVAHTIITVVENLEDPADVITIPTEQAYIAYASLGGIAIEGMLPYSNLGPTPDEGYFTTPIIDVDTVVEQFVISGDLIGSNVVAGQTFTVKQSTGNNGVYTIASISYNAIDDETTIAVVEDVTDPIVDGNIVIDIISNAFVIDGNRTGRFIQGKMINVVGGSHDGVYTVLYSDYVDGKTRIRIMETLEDLGDDFIPGLIKDHTLGYDEVSEICTTIPELNVEPNEFIFTSPESGIASDTTSAMIAETLTFGWGSSHQWPIVSTNQATSSIFITGDITGALDIGDEALVIESEGNDGEYEVVSFSYNIGTNESEVILTNPVLPVDPPAGLEGYFKMEDIDITSWYQYLIKEANATTNEFILNGNATADIQMDQQFRVLGTPSNDGIYTVTGIPTFDGLNTIIPVASIDTTENGGWVESYRDYGIRLILTDQVGVSVGEEAAAVVLTTGGPIIGAWDYDQWDIGSFDESLGTVIHLYSNTF